jgi:hypothetical protein
MAIILPFPDRTQTPRCKQERSGEVLILPVVYSERQSAGSTKAALLKPIPIIRLLEELPANRRAKVKARARALIKRSSAKGNRRKTGTKADSRPA